MGNTRVSIEFQLLPCRILIGQLVVFLSLIELMNWIKDKIEISPPYWMDKVPENLVCATHCVSSPKSLSLFLLWFSLFFLSLLFISSLSLIKHWTTMQDKSEVTHWFSSCKLKGISLSLCLLISLTFTFIFFYIFLYVAFYFFSFYESSYLWFILLLSSSFLLFGFAGSLGTDFFFLVNYFSLFSLIAIFSFILIIFPPRSLFFKKKNCTIQKLSIITVIFFIAVFFFFFFFFFGCRFFLAAVDLFFLVVFFLTYKVYEFGEVGLNFMYFFFFFFF
mgnify:CR=1 FL=1